MTDLHATIRLRPTRIGFLVRPTDFRSLKRIMRASACVWGGTLNPIIPVFRSAPREWDDGKHSRVKGYSVARGYIRFFEPDVYVEAEEGLSDLAGLGALREKYLDPLVITLDRFLEPDHRGDVEPYFGLSIIDVLRHRYTTERRFQLRDEHGAIFTKPRSGDGLTEVLFGAYPNLPALKYMQDGYGDVFQPQEMNLSPETWLQVFEKGAMTPLRVTREGLPLERSWYHDPIVFIFDPARPTDLIDLWNLCIEPAPVLPVPVEWVDRLSHFLRSFIEAQHRPLKGNPHGVMHHATVEFARSIAESKAKQLAEILRGMPQGSWAFKTWRNRIWERPPENGGPRYERAATTFEEQRKRLQLNKSDGLRTEFDTLSPPFAARYGGHNARWVNVLSISNYGHDRVATLLPLNTFDRRWPELGMPADRVGVSTEGWAFLQKYERWIQPVQLLDPDQSFVQWLGTRDIKAGLSEPGRIAKEMIQHLDGLWAVHLLADLETLQLLNKMAGGLRRRSNRIDVIEERFENRATDAADWEKLTEQRLARGALPRFELSDFTKRNIIRLGLETDCPHCRAANWRGLDAVDYDIRCDRCLKAYPFPQRRKSDLGPRWKYPPLSSKVTSSPGIARATMCAHHSERVLWRNPILLAA